MIQHFCSRLHHVAQMKFSGSNNYQGGKEQQAQTLRKPFSET